MPCAAPPWPGWVATGVAERTDESSPMTSPRPFRRCPVWATPPAWDWVPPACDHHMTVLAARNRQGGAKEEHMTKRTSKIMAVQFDPSSLLADNAPNSLKTLLTAKMHSRTVLANYEQRLATFFLNKWMFEKEIPKRRREMCCNKEAVKGACFWIFLRCSYMWEKKELYSSVWRLRCAISMELLTLVCVCNIFTPSADLVLPRCFVMADGTCLCTYVAEEDKHLWLLWWFDNVLGHSRSLSLSHLHAILDGQSALCSIASFYDIVYALHCRNSAESCVKSSLIWLILDWRLMLFKSAVDQASTNMRCCYTSFNTSCLVFVPYDHSHQCIRIHRKLVATGSFVWPADREC